MKSQAKTMFAVFATITLFFVGSSIASAQFTITIPNKDISKYSHLNLSIRGLNEAPGVIKMILGNQRNEKATYYIQNVQTGWQKVSIPLDKLNLTDWSTVTDVSFVLEAWNMDFKKGTVLIDDLAFSN